MTERSEKDTVAFEVVDRIAWVKFNRPEKRNAHEPEAQPAHDGGAR